MFITELAEFSIAALLYHRNRPIQQDKATWSDLLGAIIGGIVQGQKGLMKSWRKQAIPAYFKQITYLTLVLLKCSWHCLFRHTPINNRKKQQNMQVHIPVDYFVT